MVGIRAFPLGARPIFKGYISFREGISHMNWDAPSPSQWEHEARLPLFVEKNPSPTYVVYVKILFLFYERSKSIQINNPQQLEVDKHIQTWKTQWMNNCKHKQFLGINRTSWANKKSTRLTSWKTEITHMFHFFRPPSRKITYPKTGKGTSSSKLPLDGIC